MKITFIQYCRLKYLLSKNDLANLLGVSRVTVNDWERMLYLPVKSSLEFMSELFKVDATVLFTQIEVPQSEIDFIELDYNWRHKNYPLRLAKKRAQMSKIDSLQNYFLSVKLTGYKEIKNG